MNSSNLFKVNPKSSNPLITEINELIKLALDAETRKEFETALQYRLKILAGRRLLGSSNGTLVNRARLDLANTYYLMGYCDQAFQHIETVKQSNFMFKAEAAILEAKLLAVHGENAQNQKLILDIYTFCCQVFGMNDERVVQVLIALASVSSASQRQDVIKQAEALLGHEKLQKLINA